MMTLSGLFSSWATPETSWPSADIFAACARRHVHAPHGTGVVTVYGQLAQPARVRLVAVERGAAAAEEVHEAVGDELGDPLGLEGAGQLTGDARERLGHVAPALRLAIE